MKEWIDYAKCLSKECPRYHLCMRGAGFPCGKGTVCACSDFSTECNEEKGYTMYLPDYGFQE